MERYEGSGSWARYRTLLAERAGIALTSEPEEGELEVRGHRLHLDRWPTEGGPRGTVILVHGGGGNGRVLAPFAPLATAVGWEALAPDLPGYGLSCPAPDYRGDYGEWVEVLAELAGRTTGPVVLAGFSPGGLTAVFAAQQAATVPLSLAAPLRAMTADPELQRWFLEDPLLGRLRVPLGFLRTLHETGLVDDVLPCPLLLVHPGADAWTPVELSRRTLDQLRGRKRLRVLSNGSHLPVERPAYDELEAEFAGFLAAIGRGNGG
jgi:alpha-beta hydrolase superfamily lysophospholipase